MRYINIFGFALGLILISTSCEKDFLDVNVDPNNAAASTVDKALPAAQGYTAYSIGCQLQILGGIWSQYWTQGPTAGQYESLDRYQVVNTDYTRTWQDFYAGSLRDFKFIVDEGLKVKNNKSLSAAAQGKGGNYAAIAKIMMAYNFQVLTDIFGDIPFTEALNGDAGNLSPKFDSQEAIYDGLIKLVDEAIVLIDHDADHPGKDDLIFGGDMDLWTQFANTLKLKIYLRQSSVRPNVAQAGIAAMYANGDEFLEESAQIGFTEETFNKNPFYAVIKSLGIGNLIASNTLLNYMKANGDIRMEAAFVPNSGGAFVGINQGEGKLLPNPGSLSATNFALPGPAVGGMPAADPTRGATAPVIFISAEESYFLQAEASARGWGTGNAQNLYESGIEASFERWRDELEGLDEDVDAGLSDYLDVPAVAYDGIKSIITQKWVAMAGIQSIEAWNEFRRTNYPDFLIISKNSKIGNVFPARVLYPDSEQTRNSNFPGQKAVTDKVWWDVN